MHRHRLQRREHCSLSRTACPTRDACDGATAKPHWSDRSWPGPPATMSHPWSSVTDSGDPWTGASGTSGSSFAAVSGSSYCGGARTGTANSVSYLSSSARSPLRSLSEPACRRGVASEREFRSLDRPCHRLDYFTNFSSCPQLLCSCYPPAN